MKIGPLHSDLPGCFADISRSFHQGGYEKLLLDPPDHVIFNSLFESSSKSPFSFKYKLSIYSTLTFVLGAGLGTLGGPLPPLE